MKNKRVAYLDLLRIIASFAVVVIHVTSIAINQYNITSTTYMVNALINSALRWAVPVFFMISGALFLDPNKQISIRKLYTKNIFRIVVCIVVWGFFYSILDQYLYGTLSAKSILIAVYGIISGNTGYHMWFLYTLVMLYIATPLFRLITCYASKSQLEYALIMWIIFSIITEQINEIPTIWGLNISLSHYSPFVVAGYGGYYLLGHYLISYPLKGVAKRVSYTLSILSLVCIISIKWLLVRGHKASLDFVEAPLGIFSYLIAIAVFTIMQNIKFTDSGTKFTAFLGNHTFGIYLTHVFFISLLYHILGAKPNFCHPALAVLLSSIGVFAASFLVSWGLSKVPLLNKLL